MAARLISLLLRVNTILLVARLRLMGRKIKVGRGTTFSLSARISPGNGVIVMGKNCFIGAGTVVRANGGRICLSDNVTIGEYCILHGQGKIFMGRETLVATHVSFVPNTHRYNRRDVPVRHQGVDKGGIWIGPDCWIGSGARILNNTRLGGGSVVGANTVVTKNVEPFSVLAGNPARKIRERG